MTDGDTLGSRRVRRHHEGGDVASLECAGWDLSRRGCLWRHHRRGHDIDRGRGPVVGIETEPALRDAHASLRMREALVRGREPDLAVDRIEAPGVGARRDRPCGHRPGHGQCKAGHRRAYAACLPIVPRRSHRHVAHAASLAKTCRARQRRHARTGAQSVYCADRPQGGLLRRACDPPCAGAHPVRDRVNPDNARNRFTARIAHRVGSYEEPAIHPVQERTLCAIA